jgi:DNA-binding GntR family transcriptional regulator
MVEIVEIRRSLEEVAIRRAMALITEEEMNRARTLADELSDEQDLGSWVERNIDFHLIFHEATRTVRLSSILSTLEEAGGVFVAQAQRLHPEIRRRAIAEHYSLIEAYEKGEVEAAVAIQYGHINHPLEAFDLDSESD